MLVALVLIGCSSSGESASTTVAATVATTVAPATTEAPAPTTTIDELARTQAVNRYVDAAKLHFNCNTGIECNGSDQTYDRLRELRRLADEIPGDDVARYVTTINASWLAWTTCLAEARQTGGDRFTCSAEEEAMKQAARDLYDALR